jgi:hypothetical protein
VGKQVNFYVIEKEYVTLLRFIQDLGLLALPRVVSTELYDLGQIEAVSPSQFQLEIGEGMFYLVPQDIPVVEVFYKQMRRDPSRSFLLPHVSPVIEFGPCRREGKKLYHNRLYIDAPRDDPWSSLVYKAYDKLARHIRKWPKVGKSAYVGPATFDLAKNEQIYLMVFSQQLRVD